MNTWGLQRLRNKPHVYLSNGEWRVILRPDYELQSFMGRMHDARWFIERLNMRSYKNAVFARTQTDAGKFDVKRTG